MEAAIQELRTALGLTGIAGTDAHVTESLGYYATDFHTAIDTEQDLVSAVKAGGFLLTCDHERVYAYNQQLKAQIEQMERLIRENALTSREIKAQYRFSFSFQRGVREGKDMHLRIG